jgi:hypothetical protein
MHVCPDTPADTYLISFDSNMWTVHRKMVNDKLNNVFVKVENAFPTPYYKCPKA